MLERLLDTERGLFFLINGTHSPFADGVMLLYSSIPVWIPFIIYLCFALAWKRTAREWVPVLLSLLAVVVLCVAYSSLITKPLFARPRPIFHPSFMDDTRTLYESIAEPYGFVSGHSATSFGMAVFSSLLFRNRFFTCVIFLWALVMVYSRVYLGVHFISDIIGGAIGGVAIAWMVYYLYRAWLKRSLPDAKAAGIYSGGQVQTIAFALIGYTLFFTLTSGLWVKFFF